MNIKTVFFFAAESNSNFCTLVHSSEVSNIDVINNNGWYTFQEMQMVIDSIRETYPCILLKEDHCHYYCCTELPPQFRIIDAVMDMVGKAAYSLQQLVGVTILGQENVKAALLYEDTVCQSKNNQAEICSVGSSEDIIHNIRVIM
jgi:hypothetical protein